MARDVQLDEPAEQLLRAASAAIPTWLRRVTLEAAEADGGGARLGDELDDVVAQASSDALDRLSELLATDVDAQRTTPLSICRDAVRGPTALLRRHDITPAVGIPGRDRSDDPYELEPASWADIDPTLHEPGLTWGAWKAMTILRRRRDDGLR